MARVVWTRDSSRPLGVPVPVRSLSLAAVAGVPGSAWVGARGRLRQSLHRLLPSGSPPPTSLPSSLSASLPSDVCLLWFWCPCSLPPRAGPLCPCPAPPIRPLPFPDEVRCLVDPHWRWLVGGHCSGGRHPNAAEPAAEPPVAGRPPEPQGGGLAAVALPRRAAGTLVCAVLLLLLIVVV